VAVVLKSVQLLLLLMLLMLLLLLLLLQCLLCNAPQVSKAVHHKVRLDAPAAAAAVLCCQ
jgi:hypothetical protein